MATLVLQTVNENGAAMIANKAACAAGGDAVVNDGRTVLVVENKAGVTQTVTITPAKTTTQQDGMGALSKAAIVVAIVTLDTAVIGPFAPALFNDINGKIAITYSAVVTLNIMAVRVAKI